MMQEIVLVGGGGHAKAVIDVIEAEGIYKIAGIIDLPAKVGQEVLGYKFIASDQDLEKIVQEYNTFCITVGHIKNNDLRVKLFKRLSGLGAFFSIIKSPLSYVSKHAQVAEGTVLMHNSFVNAAALIGKNCIINTGAIIEHDCLIGDHVHVSTAALLNGGCKVGSHVFIGSNAVLRQGVEIEEETIIGAGSVVLKNVSAKSIVVGNPAKMKFSEGN